MPCILNASSFNNGLIQSADATGVLQLQSNGTTGLSIGTGGKVSLPNTALTTASAGTLEYDGRVPYFTPLGTQRGVIPGMQYFRLENAVLGSNATGAQSIFGLGCTLSSSTVYAFELFYCITKSAGTTAHTVSSLFGGTATINNISYSCLMSQSGTTGSVTGIPATTTSFGMFIQQTSSATISASIATAAQAVFPLIRGVVSVNAGGTFIPQYSLSAAPGGAYTTQLGSYMLIYPIASSGGNVSVGTWA